MTIETRPFDRPPIWTVPKRCSPISMAPSRMATRARSLMRWAWPPALAACLNSPRIPTSPEGRHFVYAIATYGASGLSHVAAYSAKTDRIG